MKRIVTAAVVLGLALSLLSCAGGAREAEAPVGAGETGELADSTTEARKSEPAPEAGTEGSGPAIAGVRGAASAESASGSLWSGGEAPALAPGGVEGSAPMAVREAVAPGASGLKAAFADDNRQFNYFVQFLAEYGPQVHFLPIPIEERIIIRVRDGNGRSLPGARVAVADRKGRLLCQGETYADGSFLFFPGEHGGESRYELVVYYAQGEARAGFDRQGPREVLVSFPSARKDYQAVALDLLFVLDTTGSMGEEIQRLKATIEIIKLNLASLPSRPRVRFGLVLYRDRGDEYRTRVVPFTEDLRGFQKDLERVEAFGGGDTPEDLQAALEAAMAMNWSPEGIHLGFVITDAPPHLDYGQRYTYVRAAQEAKQAGIKIFGVGTGGLDLQGEIVLRQLAQYTSAKYIFLTYGESGESEGGAPGSVSHHTGANYQTDKLEAIIIRIAKEELAHLGEEPPARDEEYFSATGLSGEQREQTLGKLFGMAVSQLIDYSSVRIASGTPTAVLPLQPAEQGLALDAEYFTEALQLAFLQHEDIRRALRLVERKDLQAVLEEMELRLSDLVDTVDSAGSGQATRLGALIGADVLLMGKLYRGAGDYELFLKLVRAHTGEILSLTKARIDTVLGLEK